LLLILEVPSLCSLAAAAHGSSSSRRIQSFELDFVTHQFFHQSKIDELGDKWRLQREVDSCKAVGMGCWSHRAAALAR
tara:strand:- start:1262 stop:1495 length:234 start_codon:yes stop_codon:yes gene_type:complete